MLKEFLIASKHKESAPEPGFPREGAKKMFNGI